MKIIVILGSPNKKDGELYDVAIQRCHLAMEEYQKNNTQKIIVTGGYGEHFNTSGLPHAEYLQQFLVKNGIPPQAFAGMAKSSNTIEDVTFTKDITDKLEVSSLKIITSDYHVDRAGFIFNHFYKNTPIKLTILGAISDEKTSGLDLKSLKAHEKRALKKLKENGIEGYYF